MKRLAGRTMEPVSSGAPGLGPRVPESVLLIKGAGREDEHFLSDDS